MEEGVLSRQQHQGEHRQQCPFGGHRRPGGWRRHVVQALVGDFMAPCGGAVQKLELVVVFADRVRAGRGRRAGFRRRRAGRGRLVLVVQVFQQRFRPGFIGVVAAAGPAGAFHVREVLTQPFVAVAVQGQERIAQLAIAEAAAFFAVVPAVGVLVVVEGVLPLPGVIAGGGGVVVIGVGPRRRFADEVIGGLEDLQTGTTAHRTPGLPQVLVADLELGTAMRAAGFVLAGHGFYVLRDRKFVVQKNRGWRQAPRPLICPPCEPRPPAPSRRAAGWG